MTGSLRVYLTDKDTGDPIKGIPVWCGKTNKTKKTPESGMVQFNNLQPGRINYNVNKGGYFGYEEILNIPDATVEEGRITIRRHKLKADDDPDPDPPDPDPPDPDPKETKLVGSVLKPEGTPISFAQLKCGNDIKYTNTDGTYEFPVEPYTSLLFEVSANGFKKGGGFVSIDKKGINRKNFTLEYDHDPDPPIGKITKFTMDKTSISPGESFIAGAEVLNDGGVSGKIKLTIGLQTAPPGQATMFDLHTVDFPDVEPKRIKGFNHTFTLPSDYEGDKLYVVALAFHEG